jgi:hypothetical protein
MWTPCLAREHRRSTSFLWSLRSLWALTAPGGPSSSGPHRDCLIWVAGGYSFHTSSRSFWSAAILGPLIFIPVTYTVPPHGSHMPSCSQRPGEIQGMLATLSCCWFARVASAKQSKSTAQHSCKHPSSCNRASVFSMGRMCRCNLRPCSPLSKGDA